VSSGVNFGYLKSLPHMLGVVLGIILLQLALAFGLGNIFKLYPVIQDVLKVAGSVYLLYLAWKIINTSRTKVDLDQNQNQNQKPLTIVDELGMRRYFSC
jgi:threonine/homoserine/homoserine lactone efflux protein